MRKWIAEFNLEDGDTMPEHMDLEYKGAILDFHCRKALEQESCEDAISRQEVLEQIYDWSKGEFLRTTNPFYYLRKRIKSLPQVNTQPKTGHWKWLQYDSNPEIGNYHCSECDFIPASFNLANKHLKYCPNCVTRMKENKV